MSAYAEDVSVPEPGALSSATDDAYDLREDPFGMSASKTDAHFALLTRSVSRKRLSPEALAADAEDALRADGLLAPKPYDHAALSALLLGYQSCPGVAPYSDAFPVTRRVRTGNGAQDISRASTGALGDSVNLRGSRVGEVPHVRPAAELEVRPHEVPVIGPGQADVTVTVTTAASAFPTIVTSAGYVPSAVLQPHSVQQPYSDLLSGPGFSYAADGNGVFETDTISLGSLGSGSDYGDGYMLGSDYEHDDDTGSSDFRPSRARSAGTVCSGSGERFRHPGEDPAEPPDGTGAGAPAGALEAANRSSCGNEDGSGGAAAAVAAHQPIDAAVFIATAVGGGDGMDSKLAELRTEAGEMEEEGLLDSPPVRQGSSESVGSAIVGDCHLVGASRWASRDAAGGSRPAMNSPDAYVAAAAPLPLPSMPPRVPVALAGAAAAPMGPMTPSGGMPGPQNPLGVMAGEVSAATATATPLPLSAAAAAAVTPLLSPEVYLGFVSRLVESVRAAARAVDRGACQAERQAVVYVFPGHYAGQDTLAPMPARPYGPPAQRRDTRERD